VACRAFTGLGQPLALAESKSAVSALGWKNLKTILAPVQTFLDMLEMTNHFLLGQTDYR